MPAVVRVKRRIDEEPLSAFVLNGKKRRIDDEEGDGDGGSAAALGSKDEVSTLLKFAGTIKEQDDTATSQFARLTKDEAKELVSQKGRKPINHTERARQEMRQALHEQRFRVVNCMRTTLTPEECDSKDEGDDVNSVKEITIVDIEKQSVQTTTSSPPLGITVNDGGTSSATASPSTGAAGAAGAAADIVAQHTDSDTGYVYDLYLPENEQQANYVDLMDDNYLSVRPFDDLIYEDRYNDEDDNDEEYDSEDSNQENYFANDYPDEDDDLAFHTDNERDDDDDDDDGDEDENEGDMRDALERFVFDDNDEEEEVESVSSSDEDCNIYHDPYVHSISTDNANFVDDVDCCDLDRFGLAYARYKQRILRKGQTKKEHDTDDESDGSSDDGDLHYHSANEEET